MPMDEATAQADVAFQRAALDAGLPMPRPITRPDGDVLLELERPGGDGRDFRVYDVGRACRASRAPAPGAAAALLARLQRSTVPQRRRWTRGSSEPLGPTAGRRSSTPCAKAGAALARGLRAPGAGRRGGRGDRRRRRASTACRSPSFAAATSTSTPRTSSLDMAGEPVILDWENSGPAPYEQELAYAILDFAAGAQCGARLPAGATTTPAVRRGSRARRRSRWRSPSRATSPTRTLAAASWPRPTRTAPGWPIASTSSTARCSRSSRSTGSWTPWPPERWTSDRRTTERRPADHGRHRPRRRTLASLRRGRQAARRAARPAALPSRRPGPGGVCATRSSWSSRRRGRAAAAPDAQWPPSASSTTGSPTQGRWRALAAGLEATDAELVLVAGGDQPDLTPALLRLLIESIRDADAAVLAERDRPRPLPAVLRRSPASAARSARLVSDQRSLRA